MTKEQVEAWGARWQEPNPTEYQTTMAAAAIPKDISEVSDDILKEVIQCENCKRAYRIIQAELQFLRQVKIPLPRTCVDCRHYARIAQRNRAVFYHRACMCSQKHSHHEGGNCRAEFETSYAPERTEKVYCESCYQKEVL